MNTKKTLLFAIACIMCAESGAWSRRNHEAIAYIAEQHLTPEAYSAVKEILHGRSLTYYAGWMDDFRDIELLKLPEADENGNEEIKMVHYYKVDKKFQPVFTPYRDALWLLSDAVEILYNRKSLTDERKLDCMKVIIHLVGDIHCPGHISYADRRDQKLAHFKVVDHRGKEVNNFHKFLDFTVLDWRFPGGMTDLAYVADPTLRPNPNEEEIKYMQEVQAGPISEWGMQIAVRCRDLYKTITPGHHLTVEETQWIADMELDLILRAGYRLSKILNDIFAG